MTVAPHDMLCFALYSAAHAMQQAYKPLLDALGITYPQYLVLSALWQGDAITVGEIGRQVQLESNTLTPLLKRLEAQGLLKRGRDGADERQVRVTLTEDGHALRHKAADVPRCILEKTGLAAAEADGMRLAVQALRDRLRGGAGV